MRLIAIFLFSAMSLFSSAQLQPAEPDKSPMDISYCPLAYPILRLQNKTNLTQPNARLIYSRPQKNGRPIFGNIVKYNEVWRMGANESTELELFRHATINGKKVPKGRYSLFCIPQPNAWTIIINKANDGWGAFSYNSNNDLLRFSLPLQKNNVPVEYFTMYFDLNCTLNILWDDVQVQLPFLF